MEDDIRSDETELYGAIAKLDTQVELTENERKLYLEMLLDKTSRIFISYSVEEDEVKIDIIYNHPGRKNNAIKE